jgi:hypothetical protein
MSDKVFFIISISSRFSSIYSLSKKSSAMKVPCSDNFDSIFVAESPIKEEIFLI